jgi:hypothetical protein
MSLVPIVRYMILCEDWAYPPDGSGRPNIFGLLTTIRSSGQPPYPLNYPQLSVYVALTEARGKGEVHINCIHEETGTVVIESPPRPVVFGNDPLAVVGAAFRFKNCLFPQPGLYSVQFWYNDSKLAEHPLRLR